MDPGDTEDQVGGLQAVVEEEIVGEEWEGGREEGWWGLVRPAEVAEMWGVLVEAVGAPVAVGEV